MQYAIVSDIHANLQAWNAVLLDIRSLDLDKIICLGDLVGYGPNPAEVLESVHGNVDYLVLGNHDAVVCGKLDPSLFNESARGIIEWTERRLNKEAVSFLKSLPLSLDGRTFRCAHGDFGDPAAFNYIIDPEDASPSWHAVENQLLFVGHTHHPAIFLLGESGTPRVVDPQDFVLEPEKRFLVNVGSVGQPRDGETRACYCILDSAAGSVCWRRIPFDIDAYRSALENTGVSVEPSYFLRHDPRQGKPPLRELLNFSPPANREMMVRDAVEVQELTVLKRSLSRWRILTTGVITLSVAAGIAAGTFWWRHHDRAVWIEGSQMQSIHASSRPHDRNLLMDPGRAETGQPIPGWKVLLGNRHKQSISAGPAETGGAFFLMVSETAKDELLLSSPPILVRSGMKLCLDGFFEKSPDFRGEIAVSIPVTRILDTKEEDSEHARKAPNPPDNSGWGRAKRTFEIPANASRIRFQVRGKFTGKVRIRDLALTRR